MISFLEWLKGFLCLFCCKQSGTVPHVFRECEKVEPILCDLLQKINDKLNAAYQLDHSYSIFEVSADLFALQIFTDSDFIRSFPTSLLLKRLS